MNRLFLSLIVFMSVSLPVFAQDIPLSQILVAKEGWREVEKNLAGVTFLQPEPSGAVKIFRGAYVGRISPNGVFSQFGAASPLLMDQSMALSSTSCYSLDEALPPSGLKFHRVKFKGPKTPTCLLLWPDEGHLVIGEADGAYLWAVRIEKDGSFGPGDRYYSLRTVPNEKMHVTAMAIQEVNAGYLLFACTPLGIQVFDPTGRLCGVIAAPAKEKMTAIAIGGPNAETLFVASGDKVYARKIQGKGQSPKKKAK